MGTRASETLRIVAQCCHKILLKSRPPLNYLLDTRKLTKSSIERFCIGYFPELSRITSVISKARLVEVGLARAVGGSELIGRVTFPITDYNGNIVAITGRPPISEEQRKQRGIKRKYWHNTFDKSKHLYNLHQAIPAIREKGYVIVTEGQTDVIMATQHNVDNIVCTSSTALTSEHVKLLARYAERIVILYDNDLAANEALSTIKQKIKWKSGIQIQIARLPVNTDKKEDLDSYLQEFGSEKLLSILEPSGDNAFTSNIQQSLS